MINLSKREIIFKKVKELNEEERDVIKNNVESDSYEVYVAYIDANLLGTNSKSGLIEMALLVLTDDGTLYTFKYPNNNNYTCSKEYMYTISDEFLYNFIRNNSSENEYVGYDYTYVSDIVKKSNNKEKIKISKDDKPNINTDIFENIIQEKVVETEIVPTWKEFLMTKCKELGRLIEIPGVYEHFKKVKNNERMLYAVSSVSLPMNSTKVLNILKDDNVRNLLVDETLHFHHTELGKDIEIYRIKDLYFHDDRIDNEILVIYTALYSDRKTYLRPLPMFLGKVDKKKYPRVKQTYRLEKIEG